MKVHCTNPEEVVKEAFWLAWNACGSPLGMGMFQDNPRATKEDIWNNLNQGKLGGDYPNMEKVNVLRPNSKGDLYADYVFGRMMKLGFEWDGDGVTIDENRTLRRDYQGWCGKYPTYLSLIEAAIRNVAAVPV
jgi:hypothetical protein